MQGLAVSVTATAAFVVVMYGRHASDQGWPVGRWFRGPNTTLVSLCYVTLFSLLGLAYFISPWWHPVAVLALSAVLARGLISWLGPAIQPVAAIALSIGWVLLAWSFN